MVAPTKQAYNETTLRRYAAFLLGLFLVAVAVRWMREYSHRASCRDAPKGLRRRGREACLRAFSLLDRRSDWAWFGRPAVGLVALVCIYLAATAYLSSTHFVLLVMNHWASRFGWMCAANMTLCVFFGLKNTPLSFMRGISHSQLNILHRIVGYAAVFLLLLHALFYTIHYGRQGRLDVLLKKEDYEGMGAGVAMLVLLMGVFRHRGYEIFYASHIIGFLAAAFLTSLHRPNWVKKLPALMIFTVGMWALDRIIRLAKLARNFTNNHATFIPLPDGGTRILLKKPRVEKALPGSHCFLWIPRIRLFQSHPFTIVGNDHSGLELVMKSHQGFTSSVGAFASRNPGRVAWASVDGPYGSCPGTEKYDKLILIAGGSGAAFTFGLMNRVLSQCEESKIPAVEFAWAVRRKEHLSWFSEHVKNLSAAGPAVSVSLFVTHESASASASNNSRPHDCIDEETGLLSEGGNLDYETTSDRPLAEVSFTKMNVEAIINKAMDAVGRHRRVLVAACGPRQLMDAVEDSACRWRDEQDIRIDVHCEDF